MLWMKRKELNFQSEQHQCTAVKDPQRKWKWEKSGIGHWTMDNGHSHLWWLLVIVRHHLANLLLSQQATLIQVQKAAPCFISFITLLICWLFCRKDLKMPRVKQIASISLMNLCLHNILANIDRFYWKFMPYIVLTCWSGFGAAITCRDTTALAISSLFLDLLMTCHPPWFKNYGFCWRAERCWESTISTFLSALLPRA